MISSWIILIKLEDVFSPESYIEAISAFVLLFTAISLFYTIFLSLSVFKIADTGTMPTSEEKVLPCFYADEQCKQTEISDAYIDAVLITHNEKLTVQREFNRKTTTIQRLSNQNQLNTMRITLNPTAVQRKNNQNR